MPEDIDWANHSKGSEQPGRDSRGRCASGVESEGKEADRNVKDLSRNLMFVYEVPVMSMKRDETQWRR